MCVWALLLAAQLASAHAPVHPETRVGDFEVAADACVGLFVLASSSRHQENVAASTAEASGYPHAAKGAGGLVAQNGTKVTGYTKHGLNRAIGDGGKRAGTKASSIQDALK